MSDVVKSNTPSGKSAPFPSGSRSTQCPAVNKTPFGPNQTVQPTGIRRPILWSVDNTRLSVPQMDSILCEIWAFELVIPIKITNVFIKCFITLSS